VNGRDEELRETDARQSPVGFYNLGLDYLAAADAIAGKHLDREDPFKLAFESPIRHLYAHAWELFLKACIFQQGMRPSQIKRTIGHSLTKAWEAVDKERFEVLDLHPGTRLLMEGLDQFHPSRMDAYPVTGYRRQFTLTYLRAASQRFRISRAEIARLFLE